MSVVAVLGASSDSSRYSYQAVALLKELGHEVFPIHPKEKEILGQKVYPHLSSLPKKVETLTMYVNSALSTQLQADILKLNPRRVIFNPGSENVALAKELQKHGIEVEEACTLVLLRTGQF